ncbi:MAG: amidohydrolase family protein [Acidobacteria bacterium]|nr:amidohydrolase family protein [Acidobacteriota bacterium]MBI3661831.1 amidohydrolase family protein [Acidobacteriota bacterium]
MRTRLQELTAEAQRTQKMHGENKGVNALTLLTLFVALVLLAPAAMAQSGKSYAITGAKIYTLAGPPIANGTIVIKDGKIAAVGANVSVPSGAQVINAKGLEVYPGLFNAVTEVGLVEVGSGEPGTVDTNELGDYNPQVAAAVAVHVESEHIPVVRASGITHTVSAPGGGVISGQASLIHLAGWVIDDLLGKKSAAMVLNWPSLSTRPTFDFATFQVRRRPFSEAKQDYEKKVAEMENWLERARHYAQAAEKGSKDNFSRDEKLEALAPVVKGEMPVLVMTNDDRDIKNAVEFCEKQKLKMILAGGREAWKVKDLLKQKSIPVILKRTQALPANEDEPYDKPYSGPGELAAAGVKIAFATFDTEFARTLPYEAGHAVSYGLSHDDALRAVTINPAQIFGVDKELGTLEQGKIANLIVTNGDPLEIQTEVRYLFIKGQLTSTDNKHRQLYEKYRARP